LREAHAQLVQQQNQPFLDVGRKALVDAGGEETEQRAQKGLVGQQLGVRGVA